MGTFFVGIDYLFWFLVILTTVVFIHEFGHYLLARINGVRVEVFSIGFGKELIGFNDKSGTRWKLSMIPFGGYVKMFGDADYASTSDAKKLDNMSFLDKAISFHHKELWRKALIVFAGPAFNYITAISIIMGMFYLYGKPVSEAIITNVVPESAASIAGLRVGDKVTSIDKKKIQNFEEIRQILSLNTGTSINIAVERSGKKLEFKATPKMQSVKDAYGNKVEMPVLGITSGALSMRKLTLTQAGSEAIKETFIISASMLKALGQIIAGDRSVKQLGGPIKIAQYSGQSAKYGIFSILWFIALISINLGLLNLLPLPLLDGGHIAYYMVEALTGKPVGERFQLAAMKVSFVLLITLMLFVTFNDIMELVRVH
jgi:regulator of sigma E protease